MGNFEAGPRKLEIDAYASLGNEACIALKKALPKEIFENNKEFTLVAEENAEAFYKNTIMVPSHPDIPMSHYENMVATVKAKYPKRENGLKSTSNQNNMSIIKETSTRQLGTL